jgi:hypothetical protein
MSIRYIMMIPIIILHLMAIAAPIVSAIAAMVVV